MFSSPAACIKSINERLNKLIQKYGPEGIGDIAKLKELRIALEKIDTQSFSRYNKLLQLLMSSDYGWNARNKSDRIVIFTERIETMRFVAAQLRKDLQLSENAVQEMYGGLNDFEQQKIVEDFGRDESPIRILVASDVASEGINLHYLCHRLIHFDIPWSLMVFQQRNGRIDRYGQKEQPDIRYFLISSISPKIKGDMRIMEILVAKEDQAYKNIGDPALLMGKFNIEEEEQITAEAIEKGLSADAFNRQIDNLADDFDPFELLMAGASEGANPPEIHTEETLYKDIDFLKGAITYFAQSERHPIHDLQTVEGVEIEITPDLRRRLSALLPEEAMPTEDYLRLSPDKAFCMAEMKRSMQNNMSETAWPQTQFLWPLHPIYDWINDKTGLLYGRGEAPLIGLNGRLAWNECIFVIAGTIPNRRSTPVVDEWFGLHFINETFADVGEDIGLPDEFFEEEWLKVICAQEAYSQDLYLKASRLGRGTRLDRKKRMQVWQVFEEYQNIMRERQLRDVETAMYECRKMLEKTTGSSRYAHVVVDEGQDLSMSAYRLLRALAGPEHPNDLFIVGDSHQRIYKNKPILSQCGINVRGRSSYLKINYRTTEEIRKFAFGLLKGISFDDLDDAYDLWLLSIIESYHCLIAIAMQTRFQRLRQLLLNDACYMLR